MKPLHWTTLVLICFGALLITGVSVWLVAAKYAPPALLLAPLSAVLTGGASAAVFYMRGLIEMPPHLEGASVEARIIQPVTPPTARELLGTPPSNPPPPFTVTMPEMASAVDRKVTIEEKS